MNNFSYLCRELKNDIMENSIVSVEHKDTISTQYGWFVNGIAKTKDGESVEFECRVVGLYDFNPYLMVSNAPEEWVDEIQTVLDNKN